MVCDQKSPKDFTSSTSQIGHLCGVAANKIMPEKVECFGKAKGEINIGLPLASATDGVCLSHSNVGHGKQMDSFGTLESEEWG